MRKTIELGVFPSLVIGVSLFGVGLLALNHMVNIIWPFDVARLDLVRATALDRIDATLLLEAANREIILAFLAAVLMTITGLMLPLTFFLNKRFSTQESPRFLAILRQSMWVGLWVTFCVWLQMNRTLGVAVAGLVAVVFIMFEVLLQVRTHAVNVTTR